MLTTKDAPEQANKDSLCIAQLGIGYWGPNLLRNLVAERRCDVKVVCDLADSRLDLVRNLYPSVECTTNFDDILCDPQIDAVVIATPVSTHFGLAAQALESGKHVLVEKPLATRTEEVETIGQLAHDAGLIAMVGHTFLFSEPVRKLRQIVQSEEFGRIRTISSQRLNLGRIRSDVNVIWNLAPHDVSIIQYLLDDSSPHSVSAQAMDYIQEGIHDVAFIQLAYPSKIMAHIHVSWLDPQKTRRMTIVGENQMVVYDDMADHKIAIYDKGIDRVAEVGREMDFDQISGVPFHHRSGDVVFPRIEFSEPLHTEISHFLACIRGEEKCLTGPEHARGVVEILERAGDPTS